MSAGTSTRYATTTPNGVVNSLQRGAMRNPGSHDPGDAQEGPLSLNKARISDGAHYPAVRRSLAPPSQQLEAMAEQTPRGTSSQRPSAAVDGVCSAMASADEGGPKDLRPCRATNITYQVTLCVFLEFCPSHPMELPRIVDVRLKEVK